MKLAQNRRLLALALASVSCIALGDDGHRTQAQFIGVLTGQVVGLQADPERCPNPSLPLRIDVVGTAQTTLGGGQYTQTHCEDVDHTVARQGVLSVTLADGTRLFSAYQSNILPTPTSASDNKFVISGQYHNTGGTGALARVHGMGITAGMVDVSTFTVVLALSGSL